MNVLHQIGRLLMLCIRGPGGRLGVLYFAIVLGLNLAGVYITVRMVAWTAAFYNALEKLNVDEVVRQIGIFAILVGLNASRALIAEYVRKLLQIRWRQSLMSVVLDLWLSGKAYWHLQPGFSSDSIDNPDQRIADDCRMFVDKLLSEALDLITSVVGLTTYIALLWSLSTFPLAFSLLGFDVSVPRYMVWAAFIYVALSSGLTHALGRPLKNLFFQQQRREGDLRFALARLRETAGEIALAGGEPAERRLLDRRFGAIRENWRRLINREFVMGCFTRPYMFTVLRIPVFLALPAYLAGQVTLGGLMQLGSAFSNVVTSLSWFIFSYRDLADLVATTGRLDSLIAVSRAAAARPAAIAALPSNDDSFRIDELRLDTPNGVALQAPALLELRRGETVWISGASGIGKSTFLKALAGLWPYGSGTVLSPAEASRVFLSQQPYLPLDDLSAMAAYPRDPETLPAGAVPVLMRQVGLGHRLDLLDADNKEGAPGLSGGEKQRLALLRLLVLKPDWAFLDEATSALDVEAERQLYALLRQALPDTTFVVVAHREPVGLGPLRRVDFAPSAQAA
ncbi:MAG: ABC transporter ATP-binding protein/permease [Reyranellaceae bacterium]